MNTGKPKLTPDCVRKIRAEYQPHKRGHGSYAIAKRYGVTKGTIQHLINGRSWRNVD